MSVVPRIRIALPIRSTSFRSAVDSALLHSAPPVPVPAFNKSLLGTTWCDGAAPVAVSSIATSSSPFFFLPERSRQQHYQPKFFSTTSASAASAAAATDHSVSSENRNQETTTTGSGDDGPRGELFASDREIGPSLVGKAGWVRRTFGPRSNAEAMLTCGGEALAAHASFDPDYIRAKGWIRQHAVGPAVLSPVLVSGLVGALVEAAFPQSVPDTQSIAILRPLIVGVEVVARIEVTEVVFVQGGGGAGAGSNSSTATASPSAERNERRQHGYTVRLKTTVSRERDALALAEGSHSVWIPDYLRM